MKFPTKLVSLAAATALAAGIGLAASTPASADGHLKTGGATTITLDSAVAAALQAEDISLNVVNGGKAHGTHLKFRITGLGITSNGDQFVKHSGTLQFIADGTVVLEASKPHLITEVETELDIADITMQVAGFGRIPVFQVRQYVFTSSSAKVNLKDMTRTETIYYTGNVRLTNNAAIVAAINTALGADVLVRNMKLGTLDRKLVLTSACPDATCSL